MLTIKTMLLMADAASGGDGSSSDSQASSGTPSTGVVGDGAGSSDALGHSDSAPSSGPSDETITNAGTTDAPVTDDSTELSDNWDEPAAEGKDATAAPADELTDDETDRMLDNWIASQLDPEKSAAEVVGKIEPAAEIKAEVKPAAKVEAQPITAEPTPADIEKLYNAVEDELSDHAAKAFRTLVDGLRNDVTRLKNDITTSRQTSETTQKYMTWKKETLPAVEAIDKLMEGDPRFGLAQKLARDEMSPEQFRPYQVLHKLAMGIQEQAKREGRELSPEALAKAAASRMRRKQPAKPAAAPSSAPKLNLPPPKQPAPRPPADGKVESEAEFLAGLSKSLARM